MGCAQSKSAGVDDPKGPKRPISRPPVTPPPIQESPSEREIVYKPPPEIERAPGEFARVYVQERELGFGAFAKVFVGKHRPTGKKYAIKKVDRSKMMWGDRDALKDEISNLKTVREGPHIVQLYEEYYEEKYCYLVMELMQGGELFDRIIQKRTFTEAEARDVTRCMLEALQFMHDKRVTHRDLKPENLLLPGRDDDTNIKLADFGFAKQIKVQNGCRTLCGTPGYLAPEILERWPSYDTQCDLWSVGVILFLLLGGYLPFEDDDEDKVFDRTRNCIYDFHPDYWGCVSGNAKALVVNLLTINPAKRLSAPKALKHPWMLTGDQVLRSLSIDTTRLEATLAAKKKLRAAVATVVAANRLQELKHDFDRYMVNKQQDELRTNFSVRLSVVAGTGGSRYEKDDSESGLPLSTFYDLGELLGEGGFSKVYRAKHKKTLRSFAVKDVDKTKLPDEAGNALQDEITCLKLLRGGPHIVRLHDVFETPEHTYMVMEEMKGGELLQRIVEKEVYTEREARQTCKILFGAIDYCHRKRIAHRDIKPENLLLVEKGDDTSIKIADFGFARKVTKPKSLKTLCGTPAYVAPEVLDLKSKGYDERADMWSCGVVTYILLGGYAPFEGAIEDLAITILQGKYEFHEEFWSDISQGAKDLISSLLQVSPKQRITAEEALQNEWMIAEEETLTIKDLSAAREVIKRRLPVEKLRGAVQAVIASNKLTSLGELFTGSLATDEPGLRRDILGHSIVTASSKDLDVSVKLEDEHEESASSGKSFGQLYDVGEELGSGAFSVVKDSRHKQSQKQYAVKCISLKELHPSDAVALQDEVMSLRVLKNCPHIVTLRDVFEEPDMTYIVLERMHGGDLIDRIIDKAHYTEADAKEVCRQLLQGVAYCHEKKIANRNLKPENLLLVSRESDVDVRISDFGYAKKVLYPNSLRTQCGTEGYVAPEILEHRPAYDVHCDMWSLGVIIFIVLGGYRPFRGDNDEVMRQIRYGVYEFHDKYWSHVSEDAKDLIREMLTVDVHKRITAARALQSSWITADSVRLGKLGLDANKEKLRELFEPKDKFRQVVKMIIATNKLRSLGNRFRAFQDF